MSIVYNQVERGALQDVSTRVNQLPIPPCQGSKTQTVAPYSVNAESRALDLSGQTMRAATNETGAGSLQPPTVARKAARVTKPSSRKRKSESSLEDDIAAYKQNLDHIYVDCRYIDLTCNEVRSRINKLIDAGIMKKGEFCKVIGCSNSSVHTFLAKRQSMEGSGSVVYVKAWEWFKKRDLAGLKMPDVKKRQKAEAEAKAKAASASASAPSNIAGGAPAPSRSANGAPPNPGPTTAEISAIHLPGEETDSVPVYDTCDEVREKIRAHMETPGLTQAQFCRDLYAQLHRPSCKSFQSKVLNDFRGKTGPRAGCTGSVFYAAYVFFEKKRIAEGKPKSQHRLEMERIWAKNGGFDREHDGRTWYTVLPGEVISENKYGEILFE
ncbi:hypothetical protein F4775DRAFT_531204 [Biscogniauxia sp. FL1348]|nr:hypothetical protein F4775DRAFT_531204 [Biscogniauxia sp. FL1348]